MASSILVSGFCFEVSGVSYQTSVRQINQLVLYLRSQYSQDCSVYFSREALVMRLTLARKILTKNTKTGFECASRQLPLPICCKTFFKGTTVTAIFLAFNATAPNLRKVLFARTQNVPEDHQDEDIK